MLPGLSVVPSGIVTSLINTAASQRLTGTGEKYKVDVARDNVAVVVVVGFSPGGGVEVANPLLGVVVPVATIAFRVCAAAV